MQPAQALEHAWEADSFFKLSFHLTIPVPPSFPGRRQLRLLETGMASPRIAQIEVLRMVMGKESGVQCEVSQPSRFDIPRDLGQFFFSPFPSSPYLRFFRTLFGFRCCITTNSYDEKRKKKTWENLGLTHKENQLLPPRSPKCGLLLY